MNVILQLYVSLYTEYHVLIYLHELSSYNAKAQVVVSNYQNYLFPSQKLHEVMYMCSDYRNYTSLSQKLLQVI